MNDSPSRDRAPAFDFLAAAYDAFMGWEGRLAREIPFLVEQLQAGGARRLLDVACGTGQHALALARQGYQVEGIDASPEMIEQARALAQAEGEAIPFHIEDMRRVHRLGLQPADAVLCLGNAVPQLTTRAGLRRALAAFRRALRPGGLVILHQRNWHRVWTRRERWMPVRSATVDGEAWLLLRFYDFHPRRRLTFQVVWLQHAPDGWRLHRREVGMRAWFQEDLQEIAAGLFEPRAVCGRFDGSALEPLESPDLIWVGRATGQGPQT